MLPLTSFLWSDHPITMNEQIEGSTNPTASLGSVVSVVPTGGESGTRASSGRSVSVNTQASDLASAEDPPQQNIGDAVKYLDKVKHEFQFGNKPQIYIDFLEIMKGFKTQGLDTVEVINRVSKLFHGYPDLISGFAKFLPPNCALENDKVDRDSSLETATSAVVNNEGGSVIREQWQHDTSREGSQIILKSFASTLPIPTMSTGSCSYTHLISADGAKARAVHNIENIPPLQDLPPIQPPVIHPSNVSNSESVGVQGSTLKHSLPTPDKEGCSDFQCDEFQRVLAYVNKIKERFHAEPKKYMKFLTILHHYRNEELNFTANGQPHPEMQQKIYIQVSNLFGNHEDLLEEFGIYLRSQFPTPPYPSTNPVPALGQIPAAINEVTIRTDPGGTKPAKGKRRQKSNSTPATSSTPRQPRVKKVAAAPKKRTKPLLPAPKRSKPTKNAEPTDAEKYEAIKAFGLFEKLQDFLGFKLYEDFNRVLLRFHKSHITKAEMLRQTNEYLNKSPELLAVCKVFIDISGGISNINTKAKGKVGQRKLAPIIVSSPEEELSEQDIDLSTCRRLGASYCARPKTHKLAKCSGRTTLCNSVLNDTWISTPKGSGGESAFTTTRKTQVEESGYSLEDDRFELDMVIDNALDTIRYLEGVSKKMSMMPSKELDVIQLDAHLGGSSPTLQQRSVLRIYGKEPGADMIEALQKLPTVAVPIVLKRLKQKEEEWRKEQKGFNKIWAERAEKLYLKSLDHRGSHFKQADIRALSSKSLIAEIEGKFAKRQREEGDSQGPHVSLSYENSSVFDDTCDLLLHNVRQNPGIQKEGRRKISEILKHFIPDFFNHSRRELTDDEEEDGVGDTHLQPGSSNDEKGATNSYSGEKNEDNEMDEDCPQANMPRRSPSFIIGPGMRILTKTGRELKPNPDEGQSGKLDKVDGDFNVEEKNTEGTEGVTNAQACKENYHLFFVNSSWYVFLRLHHILCERLAKLKEIADTTKIWEDPTSAAVKLGLLRTSKLDVKEYYSTFLEMVKDVLDGEMGANEFEHGIREMFGINAYFAFTIDKVVMSAVRQLQNLSQGDACLDLYQRANLRGGRGGSLATAAQRAQAEVAYQQEAQNAFGEDICVKVIMFEKNCEITMELLGCESPPENTSASAKDHVTTYESVDINFDKTNGFTVTHL